jgi:glutaredoxin
MVILMSNDTLRQPYVLIGKPNCSYCVRARTLLGLHDLQYTYIDLEDNRWLVSLLFRGGFKTVPQIFTPEGGLIGGYDDLVDYIEELEGGEDE